MARAMRDATYPPRLRLYDHPEALEQLEGAVPWFVTLLQTVRDALLALCVGWIALTGGALRRRSRAGTSSPRRTRLRRSTRPSSAHSPPPSSTTTGRETYEPPPRPWRRAAGDEEGFKPMRGSGEATLGGWLLDSSASSSPSVLSISLSLSLSALHW